MAQPTWPKVSKSKKTVVRKKLDIGSDAHEAALESHMRIGACLVVADSFQLVYPKLVDTEGSVEHQSFILQCPAANDLHHTAVQSTQARNGL